MAKLKALVKKIEEIEEGLRPLYKETADGFVLDIDDVDYENKIKEFRNNNVILTKEKTELLKSMEVYKDIDPKKYAEATKALEKINEQEDAELLKAGKLDQVLAKKLSGVEEKYTGQIKELGTVLEQTKKQNNMYRSKLGKITIQTSVLDAINKAGHQPKAMALSDIVNRAHQNWDIDEEGLPYAIDHATGEKIFDEGKPLSFDKWVSKTITTAPHLFEPSKGGGAKGGVKGNVGDTTLRVDRNDPMAFGKNLESIASGKAEVV